MNEIERFPFNTIYGDPDTEDLLGLHEPPKSKIYFRLFKGLSLKPHGKFLLGLTLLLVFSVAIFATLFFGVNSSVILKDRSGKVEFSGTKTSNGLKIEIKRDNQIKISGTIGLGTSFDDVSCIGQPSCKLGNNVEILVTPIDNGFNISWIIDDIGATFEDCFNLQIGALHWYGGPERYVQKWPIEKTTIDGDYPYVLRKSDNFGVAERYWLNSKGAYIFLGDRVPLWVDQGVKSEGLVCFKAEAKSPYINRKRVLLIYALVALDDAKQAHLDAVNTYLGRPSGYPHEKMVTEPIWTTWAKYKKPISDDVVLAFDQNIRSHGYNGGQLEIDDNWEVCYGSQVFKNDTFSDIQNTVKTLKENDWRVTLWTHPFVDDDCDRNSAEGKAKGYFVENTNGDDSAVWWDSDDSHQIDFTKSEAAKWWSARLKKLQQNPGIDSFKFDAGETDYVVQPAVYDDVELAPNILSQKYIETCSAFGNLIEVRSSFRAQLFPHFVRMLDKDSNWGIHNGLATLITTLLQLNMNGYSMVLPDMIGGNGYGQQPTGELIVRWTQANAFMPSMQFSYLPWDFQNQVEFDIEGIVKKYVDLHEKYAPTIIKAMKKTVETGNPVNPPIWWVDPTDATALATADEYLVGSEILVAPVIEEGALSRDVYLPKGTWIDGNNGTIYTGPVTLRDYSAPIEVLPYFLFRVD